MTNPDHFTVGWICALMTEYVAAQAFLDQVLGRPDTLSANDNNHYTLGKIADHYVVIAVLPDGEYGTSSAAAVATDMLRSFPSIRFGFMVGIGGGAPSSKHDIRLGDVVVSSPRDGHAGVLHYDFGKDVQNLDFRPTRALNQPPSIMRTAVSGLRAGYEMNGHQLERMIISALERKGRMREKYKRPDSNRDRLYESYFTHPPNTEGSCMELCDDSKLIARSERTQDADKPMIHYGLIASGDKLVKNALLRDKLAGEQDILCFEMEASGLMNNFPCLVIRGICDYADTHKNKEWQGYAAMAAAAYAKDLLHQIVPRHVDETRTANEALHDIQSRVDDVSMDVRNLQNFAQRVDNATTDMHKKFILAKLLVAEGAEFGTYMDQHEDECLLGTRTDLIHHVTEWATSEQGKGIFWLNGGAGTGKSTIARTLARNFQKHGILGASFFFKRGEGDRGHGKRLFSTLATQLLQMIPELLPSIREIGDDISVKSLTEQFNQLIFQPLLAVKRSGRDVQTIIIIIDALDECSNQNDIRVILQLLPQIQTSRSTRIRFFVTSRPELAVRLGFKAAGDQQQDLILHEIPISIIEDDISFFLKHRLGEIRDERSLSHDWPSNATIRTLVKMSVPLFIFAATICRLLEDPDLDPERSLQEILHYEAEESRLDGTYLPVLNQLLGKYEGKRRAELISEFRDVIGTIILLESPLSLVALSNLTGIPRLSIEARLNSLHSVLNVPTDQNKTVKLLHLSFRDFLLSPETRNKTPLSVDEEAVHKELAARCISTLRRGLKGNMCKLSPGTEYHEMDPNAVHQHLSPELQYSSCYWTYHFVRGNDCNMVDAAHSFLREHFLHWLEGLSLMGRLHESIEMIKLLRSFSMVNANTDLQAFLHDARRFVLYNYATVSRAPLQIYSSALLFAPTSSIIRTLFSSQIPPWISRYPIVPFSWGPAEQTLEHESGINQVCVSPDGARLASVSDRGEVQIWEAATGRREQNLEHDDSVTSIAFSPDGMKLASASINTILRIWDVVTGHCEQELKQYLEKISRVAFSPDGTKLAMRREHTILEVMGAPTLATGLGQPILTACVDAFSNFAFSPDSTKLVSGLKSGVQIWDINTGQTRQLKSHSEASLALCVAFSPDGVKLASGSNDGTIHIWDTTSDKIEQDLQGHSGPVFSVGFLPCGSKLASGSEDKTVRIWDIRTGNVDKIFSGHSGPVLCLAISQDGEKLASGSQDKTIKIWDYAAGRVETTLKGHSGSISAVSFSPNNRQLASGSSRDGKVQLWDILTGRAMFEKTVFMPALSDFAFSPNGATLAAISDRLRIWDVESGEVISISNRHTPDVRLAFSTDGDKLLWASGKKVRTWDIGTGRLVTEHTRQAKNSWGKEIMAFTPDSTRLAVGSGTNIEIWNMRNGHNECLIQHYGSVSCLAFSADSAIIALGAMHTVEVRDVKSGQTKWTLEGHSDGVQHVAFSPDTGKLATVSSIFEHTIRIWNLTTAELQLVLKGHSDSIRCIAFLPDGSTLASGSGDKTVRIWDITTYQDRQMSHGHAKKIETLSISPNGMRLASVSWNEVMIWDITTGEVDKVLKGVSDRIMQADFSPDGSTLATISSGQPRVQVWDIRSGCIVFWGDKHEWLPFPVPMILPGNNRIVGVSRDHGVQIWEVNTGQVQQVLLGYPDEIRYLAASPCGTKLASASYNTTRVWDLTTGTTTHILPSYGSLYFSPGGTKLSVLGLDFLQVWDVSTGLREQQKKRHPTGSHTGVIFSNEDTCLQNPYHFHVGYRGPMDRKTECREWICWKGTKILMLPSEVRPGGMDSTGDTVSIGGETGRVMIIGFLPSQFTTGNEGS